jgi:arabinosyltransferase B
VSEPAAPPPPARQDRRGEYRTARLVAVVTGLIGLVLALATPFMPVEQSTATVNWPENGQVSDLEAPLMSQVPVALSATIPCSAVAELPERGGILLSTAPAQGDGAALNAMFVRVSDKSVDVLDRNVTIATAPREQVQSGACSEIRITSDIDTTSAEFVGLRTSTGVPIAGQLTGDLRPQVVGVFSDLPNGAAPAGLSFTMDVDSRFSSSPTLIKLVAMIVALLTTAIAMVALGRLDGTDGRGHRNFFPSHWWKFTGLDTLVVGTLVVWHFIGANTSDDGYLLTMARVSDHAGYMANYFRWFGVPEAPFGWYYDVLAAMAKISTASPFIRLPALIAGILCWLVISREVAPRLGRSVRRNKVALWTGGLVFLAFWLPYNNGLRPEPIVALGALLTWCSIERAIATGRLLPAAVAVLIGAFTLAAAPTGLMCVAALLAGTRPLVRIIVKRHRQVGTLPLLAPIAAAGTIVLVVVFADQTLAAVLEATRVRTLIGPNLEWYKDFLRYYYLFVPTVDGSVARRFAFLTMILCLLTTLFILLRRRRIPGAATGPSWRLLGVVFGTIFFMMFNPTKWTHHFGAYAGIAGSLAALTAVAVSASALRSRRNRTIFLAGLLLMLALTFAGINGYWYVSSFGVPWFDKTVSLGGRESNTLFLVLFGLAVALAAWQYLREGFAAPPVRPNTEKGRRIRKFAAAPLTVIAGVMVLFEVVSLLKGAVSQYPAYSLARSNFDSVAGQTCGLAEDVLVEGDTNGGNLAPIPDPTTPLADPADPLGGAAPTGFSPNGVPADLTADYVEVKQGMGNTDNQSVGPSFETGGSAGTSGGTGRVGVNGSTAKLPFGLDPSTTPVMGSYQEGVRPSRAQRELPARRHVGRGTYLVGRPDRRHHLRAVPPRRVRQASARRHRADPGHLPAQGHRARAVVAEPAGPHRRARPRHRRGPDHRERSQPHRRPVARVHPAAGSDARHAQLDDRQHAAGSPRLGRGASIPVPATVRPPERGRGDAELPHPPRPPTRRQLHRHLAVRRERWPARVHRTAGRRHRHPHLHAGRLGSGLGLARAFRPVLPGRHRGHRRHRHQHQVRTVVARHPAGVRQPVARVIHNFRFIHRAKVPPALSRR